MILKIQIKLFSTTETSLKHLLGNNLRNMRNHIPGNLYNFSLCKHFHVNSTVICMYMQALFMSWCGQGVMNGERRSRCPIFSGVNMSSAAFVSHGCFKLAAKCTEQGELL